MIVVDASVAVKWFVPEPGNAEAKKLLQSREQLLAPELARVEVSAALVRKGITGEISAEDARDVLRVWFGAIAHGQMIFLPDDDHLPAASELALELRHALADCLYLAAAQRFEAPLITADRVFARRAAPRYPAIRLLGEG